MQVKAVFIKLKHVLIFKICKPHYTNTYFQQILENLVVLSTMCKMVFSVLKKIRRSLLLVGLLSIVRTYLFHTYRPLSDRHQPQHVMCTH